MSSPAPVFKRILLKLSGEALAAGQGFGVDSQRVQEIAAELQEVHALGVQVAVVVRSFNPETPEKTPFYEAAWFAPLVRALTVLGAVLMVLLLAVRPLLKLLKSAPVAPKSESAEAVEGPPSAENVAAVMAAPTVDPETGRPDPEILSRKVGIAQRLAADKPDRAASALKQMLAQPTAEDVSA